MCLTDIHTGRIDVTKKEREKTSFGTSIEPTCHDRSSCSAYVDSRGARDHLIDDLDWPCGSRACYSILVWQCVRRLDWQRRERCWIAASWQRNATSLACVSVYLRASLSVNMPVADVREYPRASRNTRHGDLPPTGTAFVRLATLSVIKRAQRHLIITAGSVDFAWFYHAHGCYF